MVVTCTFGSRAIASGRRAWSCSSESVLSPASITWRPSSYVTNAVYFGSHPSLDALRLAPGETG